MARVTKGWSVCKHYTSWQDFKEKCLRGEDLCAPMDEEGVDKGWPKPTMVVAAERPENHRCHWHSSQHEEKLITRSVLPHLSGRETCSIPEYKSRHTGSEKRPIHPSIPSAVLSLRDRFPRRSTHSRQTAELLLFWEVIPLHCVPQWISPSWKKNLHPLWSKVMQLSFPQCLLARRTD